MLTGQAPTLQTSRGPPRPPPSIKHLLVCPLFIFFLTLPATQGGRHCMPIRQVGTQRKKPAPRVAQPEETPREGSGCKAGPQQNLGKARARDSPGTGRGFQAPPPRKSGPPRALEIPRAPRNAARLPGNQEKNFCFFFFSFLALSPRALLLALAPTWDAPARRPAADQSPLWVRHRQGDDRRGHAPYFSVYKRRRRRPRAQIAETWDRACPCAAAWITLADDFAIFFRLFGGGVRCLPEVWDGRSSSVGRFGALRPRVLHFLSGDCRGAAFHCGL